MPDHILSRISTPESRNLSSPEEKDISLTEVEQNLIRDSLRKSGGNVKKAARLLNISYYTLRYRMKKFGIQPEIETDARL